MEGEGQDVSYGVIDESGGADISVPLIDLPGGGLGMQVSPSFATRHLAQIEMSDAGRATITSAIREEIKAVCSEKEFTAVHLLRIERLAMAAKPFFASRDPLTMTGQSGMGMYGGSGGAYIGGGVLAPSPLTETFGANALREVVEILRKSTDKQPPLTDMVNAVAEARAAGMTEIADKLQHDLEDRFKSAAPEATKPNGAHHHEETSP